MVVRLSWWIYHLCWSHIFLWFFYWSVSLILYMSALVVIASDTFRVSVVDYFWGGVLIFFKWVELLDLISDHFCNEIICVLSWFCWFSIGFLLIFYHIPYSWLCVPWICYFFCFSCLICIIVLVAWCFSGDLFMFKYVVYDQWILFLSSDNNVWCTKVVFYNIFILSDNISGVFLHTVLIRLRFIFGGPIDHFYCLCCVFPEHNLQIMFLPLPYFIYVVVFICPWLAEGLIGPDF